MKQKRKPVFTPFDQTSGLELFEPDFTCEGACAEKTELKDLNLSKLDVLKEEIQEGIADYQLIIDMERESSNRDESSIKLSNQRIGQLRAELHAVKKQIRILKKKEREDIAA